MNKSEKYTCDTSPSTYTKNSYITPVDALQLSQQWKVRLKLFRLTKVRKYN